MSLFGIGGSTAIRNPVALIAATLLMSLLGCNSGSAGGGGQSSSPGTSAAVQISSLSETTANSFDSLTVTGTGFNQGTLAISVLFIPENGDPAVTVPVSASSSANVQVMVPTFVGPTSGAFTEEIVDVQVVQFSSDTTYLSNRITGLQVSALPSVPNGIPVGAMTAALLSSVVNISGSLQSAQAGNTVFQNTAVALAQLSSDVTSLTVAVNAITNHPTQTATLTIANGGTTTLDGQTLALSDQLAQALITAIVNQGSIPTVSSSSNCPGATGNVAYDSNLCSVQTYFQTLAGQAPAVSHSKRSSGILLTPPETAVLSLYANLIFGSLAEICEPAGGGLIYQLVLAPIVTTTISSLAVNQETPPGADIVQGVGLNFLDTAFFNKVPILGTAVDEIAALKTIIVWSPPKKGILLSSGAAGLVPGGVTFLDPNTGAPTTLLQVPVKVQGGTFDSTTLAVSPAATPETLSLATSGSGTGSINSFPSGTSFPAGMVVRLTAVPTSGSTFAGWSGACSGGGACSVTMNQNESVVATFNLQSGGGGLTGTWSGNVTENGGGCSFAGTMSWSLVQSSTSLSGSVSLNESLTSGDPSVCGTTLSGTDTLQGSANGNSISLTGTEGETFTATVSGTTITGTGATGVNPVFSFNYTLIRQ